MNETNNETKSFQIFVKREYVRDAQIYQGNTEVDDIHAIEQEKYWKDCFGDMLLTTFHTKTEKQVWDYISKAYPDADANIFWINKVK